MKVLFVRIALCVAFCLLHAGCTKPWRFDDPAPAEASKGVPNERFQRMQRGVNLGGWFARWDDYTLEKLDSIYTEQDIKVIKAIGFDHIRFPLDPLALGWTPEHEHLDLQRVRLLKKALKMIEQNGLFIQMDLHARTETKAKLKTDSKFFLHYAKFWTALGPYLEPLSDDVLAVELVSEPSMDQPEKWWGYQEVILRAARKAMPTRTIIVGADGWNRADWLAQAKPYSDTNLVYNFHYYEPFVFTHQTSNWAIPELAEVQWLDYPPNKMNAAEVMMRCAENRSKQMVADYAKSGASKATLKLDLIPLKQWADRFQAKVICNEFGVFARRVDLQSRDRYLADLRSVLEELGFGWSLWEYSSEFGVTHNPNRMQNFDKKMMQSLGLTPPEKLPAPAAYIR